MQDLLQQIDIDFYRSARLLIVRAELEHLRQERSPSADVERQSKIPLDGTPTSAESSQSSWPMDLCSE
jgi:DNA replication initiation complex subunit (GINS family)